MPEQTTLVPMERDGAKPSDIYYTPGHVIASLLNSDRGPSRQQLGPPLRWVEPCAGRGDIVRALIVDDPRRCVTAYEIRREEHGTLWESGASMIVVCDALMQPQPGPDHGVITNPPFSIGAEFWSWSARAYYGAFLVRLNVLGSNTWRKAWEARRPTFLRALKRRPSFSGRGTDAAEYGWLGWRNSDRPLDFAVI